MTNLAPGNDNRTIGAQIVAARYQWISKWGRDFSEITTLLMLAKTELRTAPSSGKMHSIDKRH
jgi:hypothetical protein